MSEVASSPRAHNPLYSFLDMSTNQPIMLSQVESEHIDAQNDLLAPFKVHRYSRRLWAALLAEFLGMCIFQMYGGSANDDVAALANGITLAVIVYATANVSGGHLNPAVSFANCLTGHMSWSKGGVYTLAQVLGGILGALFETGLMPGVSAGSGSGPGCFTHLKGVQISKSQLFWWECIMTFVLISVVYATAVTKPGHGNIAPLAIGFTLYASAAVAGPYTGAALNPARVFGPALVFNCYWDTAFVYIFGQLLGGFLAAVVFLPLYGFGQFGSVFDTRIFSWLGYQVPRRFQKLPVQPPSSQPAPSTFRVAVSAKPLEFNPFQQPQTPPYRGAAPTQAAWNPFPAAASSPGQMATEMTSSSPQAPPATPSSSQSGSPNFTNRVFGNPQLGKIFQPSAGAYSNSSTTPAGRATTVPQDKQQVDSFLPDGWK